MKQILGLALVLATSSFAHASASAEDIAQAMVSPRVAPCLKELQKLANRYELSVSEISRNQDGKDITTMVTYMLIQGGDMVMGNVTLVINEKLVPQFGFPETTGRPVVQGCSIPPQNNR